MMYLNGMCHFRKNSKADPMISVACTNWDMACKQPRNFNSGCNEIKHQDKLYYSHRWTDKYRALTQKKYESDDELLHLTITISRLIGSQMKLFGVLARALQT